MTEIFTEAEAIFTPHPGSRLDRVASASAQEASPAADVAAPIPEKPYVVETKQRAAIFGGYISFIFTGAEATAYRVMPRDDERARGYILVSGSGPVLVGSNKDSLLAARANGLPTSGAVPGVAIVAAGQVLTVTHQEPVFIMADGTHAATVAVGVERWSSAPVT